MTARRGAAVSALLHPLPLAAIGLLVVNDHVLKAAYPGWVTGKLSDVAGLVFFPLLLAVLVELVVPGAPSLRVAIGCAAATAIAFLAVKTCAPATRLAELAFGALQWPFRAAAAALHGAPPGPLLPAVLVRDPTDLLALPAVAAGPWIVARRRAA
jgi:hypothetical protein